MMPEITSKSTITITRRPERSESGLDRFPVAGAQERTVVTANEASCIAGRSDSNERVSPDLVGTRRSDSDRCARRRLGGRFANSGGREMPAGRSLDHAWALGSHAGRCGSGARVEGTRAGSFGGSHVDRNAGDHGKIHGRADESRTDPRGSLGGARRPVAGVG